MKELTIFVTGMKCTGCEGTIRKALLKLNGVYDARANHRTGEVWLQVIESKFHFSEVDAALCSIGYDPE